MREQSAAAMSWDFAGLHAGVRAILLRDYDADGHAVLAGEVVEVRVEPHRTAMDSCVEVTTTTPDRTTFNPDRRDLDSNPVRVRVADLERVVRRLILEADEVFAFTDATGDFAGYLPLTGHRSTSRKKTKAERSAERSLIYAYCDAIHRFTDDMTAAGVHLRLRDDALGE